MPNQIIKSNQNLNPYRLQVKRGRSSRSDTLDFSRGFSSPFGSVKIAIKTYNVQVILLSRYILVGIVKVEIEFLGHFDDSPESIPFLVEIV